MVSSGKPKTFTETSSGTGAATKTKGSGAGSCRRGLGQFWCFLVGADAWQCLKSCCGSEAATEAGGSFGLFWWVWKLGQTARVNIEKEIKTVCCGSGGCHRGLEGSKSLVVGFAAWQAARLNSVKTEGCGSWSCRRGLGQFWYFL